LPEQNPISKITRPKRAGVVAQETECVPSKCKALCSNSSTTKKREKGEKPNLKFHALIYKTTVPNGVLISVEMW
jgi:hypothetical protein